MAERKRKPASRQAAKATDKAAEGKAPAAKKRAAAAKSAGKTVGKPVPPLVERSLAEPPEAAPAPAPETAEAGGLSGAEAPAAKGKPVGPEGWSEKNLFGKRGPLRPTYEDVERVIRRLEAESGGQWPKISHVVDLAKGSATVCQKHFQRIQQERAQAARNSEEMARRVPALERRIAELEAENAELRGRAEAAQNALNARRGEMRDRLAGLSDNMLAVLYLPWREEDGARARDEMIAALPRLAGLAEEPAEEERARAEQRRSALARDAGELDLSMKRLREAVKKRKLDDLVRENDARSLARIVCALCWFWPEAEQRQVLQGLFGPEAVERDEPPVAAKREILFQSVLLGLCEPPLRERGAAFVEELPDAMNRLQRSVNGALRYLLRESAFQEVARLQAPAVFWLAARAGNTEGMDLLFDPEVPSVLNDAGQLGAVVAKGRLAALKLILERDAPDYAITPATAGEALRGLFASADFGPEAPALADCLALLIRHGAELDDDMRGRMATLPLTGEQSRLILALDAIQQTLKRAGTPPDDPLTRKALAYGPLVTSFEFGIPRDADTIRALVEREEKRPKRILNI